VAVCCPSFKGYNAKCFNFSNVFWKICTCFYFALGFFLFGGCEHFGLGLFAGARLQRVLYLG